MTMNIPMNVASGDRTVTINGEAINLNYTIDFSECSEKDFIALAVEQTVVNITNKLFRKRTAAEVRAFNGRSVAYNAKAATADKMTSAQVYDKAISLGVPEEMARKLANME